MERHLKLLSFLSRFWGAVHPLVIFTIFVVVFVLVSAALVSPAPAQESADGMYGVLLRLQEAQTENEGLFITIGSVDPISSATFVWLTYLEPKVACFNEMNGDSVQQCYNIDAISSVTISPPIFP